MSEPWFCNLFNGSDSQALFIRLLRSLNECKFIKDFELVKDYKLVKELNS